METYQGEPYFKMLSFVFVEAAAPESHDYQE